MTTTSRTESDNGETEERIGPGPVFLLTSHRSGGTLLVRILNCHPDLVIWGEHGGWINKFAEADATLDYIPFEDGPVKEARLHSYIAERLTTRFDPWISPFDRSEFRAVCRSFIQATFSKGLSPGQRWGFKEIRYHSPITARFLKVLFPWARFVIVKRDPVQLIASNVMAKWTNEVLSTFDETSLCDLVDDCAYALAVINDGFTRIEAEFPERSLSIHYESMAASIPSLFDFLLLRQTPEISERISFSLQKPLGETPRGDPSRREEILALAAEATATAVRSIADHGIDFARVKRLSGGKYSFVVGDHHLANTPFSSIF